MKAIGLDIGTTTISLVVFDEHGGPVSKTVSEHHSDMPGQSYEKMQDAEKIYRMVDALVSEAAAGCADISCIGITGQMHGVVYLDADGNAVSPLYTWQDGRGGLPFSEEDSYSEYMAKVTGYRLSPGYGIVTHFFNVRNGLVPPDAVVFCTIQDYVAMKLAGRTSPVTDITDAVSIGLFDLRDCRFDTSALSKLGLDARILPEISLSEAVGCTADGKTVYVPIGDNQASFIGAACGRKDKTVINIGTGSQVSAYMERYIEAPPLETRPYPGGGWLLVGAPLCGGKSFALIEQFIRFSAAIVSGVASPVYGVITRLLDSSREPADCPVFTTTFLGTRQDPAKTGTISGLTTDNFTPLHFLYGMMRGMADELYAYYQKMTEAIGGKAEIMIGAGNGLRKNPHLRHIVGEKFGVEISMSPFDEESACGAALFALYSAKVNPAENAKSGENHA